MLNLQYPPYIWLLVIAIAASVTIMVVVWRRRPGAGVIPFMVLMMAIIQWTLGNTLEFLMTDLSAKFFFIRFNYIGITIVPAAWLVFVLEYTGRDKWITRRHLQWLAIEPVLVQLFIWTDGYPPPVLEQPRFSKIGRLLDHRSHLRPGILGPRAVFLHSDLARRCVYDPGVCTRARTVPRADGMAVGRNVRALDREYDVPVRAELRCRTST